MNKKSFIMQRISLVRQMTLVLAALLLTTAICPKKSEAAIGGIVTLAGGGVVGVPTMVVGGSLAGLFLAVEGTIFAAGVIEQATHPNDTYAGIGWGLGFYAIGYFGLPVALGGLLILKDETSDVFRFAKISIEQAHNLGLTKDEWTSYVNDLDLLDALSEEVSNATSQMKENVAQAAGELWSQRLLQLDPATQAALKKILLSR